MIAPLSLTLSQLQEKYAANLARAIKQYPGDYAYTSDEAPAVASRIFETIIRSGRTIKAINVDSHAWRFTCIEVGIKHTRKAIGEYLTACK